MKPYYIHDGKKVVAREWKLNTNVFHQNVAMRMGDPPDWRMTGMEARLQAEFEGRPPGAIYGERILLHFDHGEPWVFIVDEIDVYASKLLGEYYVLEGDRIAG